MKTCTIPFIRLNLFKRMNGIRRCNLITYTSYPKYSWLLSCLASPTQPAASSYAISSTGCLLSREIERNVIVCLCKPKQVLHSLRKDQKFNKVKASSRHLNF